MDTSPRVVRNGKVAVVYSPGYGAGWSTWNRHHAQTLMFNPAIVEAVERCHGSGDMSPVVKIARRLCDGNGYFGGADELEISWVPEGSLFRINEYDGAESVEVFSEANYFRA